MSSESLKVICQGCGKALHLPAESAGQSIRCPACGEFQQVPAGREEQVVFACPECGKPMRAQTEYAGQLTRCPGCTTAITIPNSRTQAGARDGIQDDAPVLARRALSEEDGPLRVRLRKRQAWPWLLVGAALLVLLVGGGLAWWFLLRGRTDDLVFIPADAQAIVSVRVADLWSTDLGKEARKAAETANHTGDLDKLAQEKLGIVPTDVERVTYVIVDGDRMQMWAVVALARTYDQKKLLDTLLPSAHEEKAGGRSYHVGKFQGDKTALYFASSKLFLVGPEEGIKYVLEMKPKSSGPLEGAIRLIRKQHHVVAALSTQSPDVQKFLKNELGRGLNTAADIKVATLTVDLGKTLDVAAQVEFASEKAARDTRALIDAGVVVAKQQWQENKDRIKRDMEREKLPPQIAFDLMSGILNSVKTEVNGTVLSASARVERNK